jgi:hypothetical protein
MVREIILVVHPCCVHLITNLMLNRTTYIIMSQTYKIQPHKTYTSSIFYTNVSFMEHKPAEGQEKCYVLLKNTTKPLLWNEKNNRFDVESSESETCIRIKKFAHSDDYEFIVRTSIPMIQYGRM